MAYCQARKYPLTFAESKSHSKVHGAIQESVRGMDKGKVGSHLGDKSIGGKAWDKGNKIKGY